MAENPENPRHRRKLRNFFVNPGGQLRLIFVVPSVAMVSVIGVLIATKSSLESYITSLPAFVPADLVRDMQQTVTFAFSLSLAFVVFATLMVIIVGILISHRFYGPLVPILRAVRAMREDNFSSELHLRPHDELQELAKALNELQSHLREKTGR